MKKLLLVSCLMAWPLLAEVKVVQGQESITVAIDGKPFTEFFFGPSAYKPYLHPLRSASGIVVTRNYPMREVEGETRDHPHHRGLWYAHGDVNGLDYWSTDPIRKGSPNPRIRLKEIVQARGGKDSGTIRTKFHYMDLENKPILEEDRTMVFGGDAKLRYVDLDIRLTALEPVTFGDTKEGTFAIRVASGLEAPNPKGPAKPERTLKIVTSEGIEDGKVWGTRARWVDYSGKVEGEHLGIAIFDHPENFRHPTYWHARTYGLFAANPFGVRDFLNDKAQDGSKKLAKGETLRFRYRVVIHPGDARQAGIESLYQAYAGKAKKASD